MKNILLVFEVLCVDDIPLKAQQNEVFLHLLRNFETTSPELSILSLNLRDLDNRIMPVGVLKIPKSMVKSDDLHVKKNHDKILKSVPVPIHLPENELHD